MSYDLDSFLENWPFEPGPLQVRIVPGNHGKPKIQLRLDLGILQMEMAHRPDGQKPFGSNSLLEHYQKIVARYDEDPTTEFKLHEEECQKLHQENMQYYHRFLAFLQLEEFELVIRDTLHCLSLIDLIEKYSNTPEIIQTLQNFKPHVMMLQVRAKGMSAIQKGNHSFAIEQTEVGIEKIQNYLQTHFNLDAFEAVEQSKEIQVLQNWIEEIKKQRPLSPIEKLQQQIGEAIAKEDYEKAARLRDALKEFSRQ